MKEEPLPALRKLPVPTRLAYDGDGDVWAWGITSPRWECISNHGTARSDEELAVAYGPISFYAIVEAESFAPQQVLIVDEG